MMHDSDAYLGAIVHFRAFRGTVAVPHSSPRFTIHAWVRSPCKCSYPTKMAYRLMQRTMAGTNPGIGARSATAEATDVPWRDQQGATETPVIWDSLPQVSARVCSPHHALAWVAPRYGSRGHPSVSHYPASFV